MSEVRHIAANRAKALRLIGVPMPQRARAGPGFQVTGLQRARRRRAYKTAGNVLARSTGLAIGASWAMNRALIRFVPYAGLAYSVYELYQAYPGGAPVPESLVTANFTATVTCAGDYDAVTYNHCAFCCTGQNIGTILGNPKLGAVSIATNRDAFGVWLDGGPANGKLRFQFLRHTAGATETDYSAARNNFAQNVVAMPAPVFDPMLMPIGEPVKMPTRGGKAMAGSTADNPYRVRPEANHRSYGTLVRAQARQRSPQLADRPPKRRTKERKIKIRGKFAKAVRVLSALTEWDDFVSALYTGLPEKYKIDNASHWDKMKALYLHSDELDVRSAIGAVIINEVIDRSGAATGRYFRETNKFIYAEFGLNVRTGARAGFRAVGQAADAWEAQREDR